MTLEERLQDILAGSPVAIPAIGDRWYAMSAPQRGVKPYGVYQVITDWPIHLHDNQTADTGRWTYQFSIWGIDRGLVLKIMEDLVRILLAQHDNGPGIRAVVKTAQRDDWNEQERLQGVQCDFVIWENFE